MSKSSSIDELLTQSLNPQAPEPKESAPPTDEAPESTKKAEVEYETDPPVDEEHAEPGDNDTDLLDETTEETPADENEREQDEYGNPKEEMPKGLKDRLDRKEKKLQQEIAQRDAEIYALQQRLQQAGASKEVQDAVSGFKPDNDSDIAWEQQLTDFVEKAVSNMEQKKQTQQAQAQEQQAERQLVEKLQTGAQRFPDFVEVVNALPMSDAMTRSLRGIEDPTAFIYAAARREPQEIKRISELRDPYAQMVAMGKLEERMRKNKPATQAPRPLAKMKEDSTERVTPKKKTPNGDDLLAQADAKRLSTTRNGHSARR